MYDGPDSLVAYKQTIHVSTINVYGGATYRLHSDGEVFGASGSIGIQLALPQSAQTSLFPNPITGEDAENQEESTKNISVFVFGDLNAEFYVIDNLFITIGMTYAPGLSPLFSTRDNYNTTVSCSMIRLGLGVTF